jgi:hypothetical protein
VTILCYCHTQTREREQVCMSVLAKEAKRNVPYTVLLSLQMPEEAKIIRMKIYPCRGLVFVKYLGYIWSCEFVCIDRWGRRR